MSEASGYTQIPNGILDRMHEMTGAEFKIVCAIARQTLGWHKTSDTISISQIEQLTGLSRPSVIVGINQAVEDGFIRKSESGYSYSYEIADEMTEPGDTVETSQKTLLVKKVYQSKNFTSKKSLPKLVKKVYQQKKERKSKTLSYERGDEQSSLALDIPDEHIEQPSPAEQKPARAKRQPDQNQQHGACLIYQELTGRHPNRVQAAQIVEHISDIERWRAIVTRWLSSGYKTTNVEGMLDWYRKNGSNGRNGNGQASRGYEKSVQVGAEVAGKPNPERAVIRPVSTDDW